MLWPDTKGTNDVVIRSNGFVFFGFVFFFPLSVATRSLVMSHICPRLTFRQRKLYHTYCRNAEKYCRQPDKKRRQHSPYTSTSGKADTPIIKEEVHEQSSFYSTIHALSPTLQISKQPHRDRNTVQRASAQQNTGILQQQHFIVSNPSNPPTQPRCPSSLLTSS